MKQIILHREQVYAGHLILVNQSHPLRSFRPVNLVPVDQVHTDILLERQTAKLLAACIQAVGGQDDILPVSGWRSQEEQQAIWNDTLKREGEVFTRQYVARPGCSEHQSGLAIDLGKAAPHIDLIRPYFPDDGVCGAFRRIAAKYGFIQRYSKAKETLTGISEEPWHFRYVGAPHAQLMADNNLCLEEYSAFIQAQPMTCVLENGRAARVSYLPCPGEQITAELPEDRCWQCSGDNQNGFLLTFWEEVP